MKKSCTLQDSKRQLYEQYALGEIDLETYQERKAVYDAELVQAKNVHAAITAQPKQIQSDYEAKLKQREIVREVGSADTLTQALIDRLISKVYIFPGNRIEIEYVTQDFLGMSTNRERRHECRMKELRVAIWLPGKPQKKL